MLTAVPLAIAAGAAAVYATRPKGPTFVQRIRTLDGKSARLFSRSVESRFDDRFGSVRDHGRDSEWNLVLPKGVHRIELVASDGRFGEATLAPLSIDDGGELVIALERPVDASNVPSGWTLVPGGSQRIELYDWSANTRSYLTADVAIRPFLVENRCVSVADVRACIAAHAHLRRPAGWQRLLEHESVPGFVPLDRRPFVGASCFEAQQISALQAARLPTIGESLQLAGATHDWWRAPARAVPPELSIGKVGPKRGHDGLDYLDYVDLCEDVDSRAPHGPFQLHHGLGNVAIWTSNCEFDSAGAPDIQRWLTTGAHWSASVGELEKRLVAFTGYMEHRGWYVAVGIRKVRSVEPQLVV